MKTWKKSFMTLGIDKGVLAMFSFTQELFKNGTIGFYHT
jgi:hypothetical protein